jgi:signal peptide peptidase SppA
MNVLDVLTSPWAIVPETYTQILDLYDRHAHGEKIDIAAVEQQMGRKLENHYRSLVIDGGVGILSIEGVLSKRMNLFAEISGGTSTQLLARDFRTALADPDVHSILLLIDSPGGEVSGTQEFADQIFEARGQKPIVAVCTGLMASAAYWIGASADEVYLSSGTDQVGSIGVVASHMDVSQAEEKRGIKVTEITAGKYKRVASEHAPLSAEGRQEIQDQVDQVYTVFVDAVARNRGVSSEKVLSDMADGRIFIGQRAVAAGLVDGRKTAAQAVQQLKDARQQLLFPKRSASALTPGGLTMATPATPSAPPQAADIEAMRTQCFNEGFKAGAEGERARIKAVEEQAMPGHEALVETMKFDGKTTGEQAAVQILAAEKKKLGGIAAHLREDAPKALPNQPSELVPAAAPQAVDRSMSDEQVEAIAKAEWAKDPKLSRQFTSEKVYCAYRKAEARGLVRVLSKKSA